MGLPRFRWRGSPKVKRSLFFQLSPNEAKSGWEERYHDELMNCLHGPACEMAGCTLGKRVVKYLDLLSEPCLPFWPQLKIDGLRVEQSHFIEAIPCRDTHLHI